MSTKLDIANAVVAEVGAHETITAVDGTDTSAAAIAVVPALNRAIPYILEKHDWPIARSRALQTADVTFDGDSRYGFRFTARTEGAWQYETEDGSILTDYAIENGYVYTNYENTYFRYTDTDLTNVEAWPELLVRVLTFYVAARVAVPLSAGEGVMEKNDRFYKEELRNAKTHYSRKGPPQTYMSDAQSQYIEAHQGNGLI